MEQAAINDPLIGAQVGNYQIRSKIGEGGMGSVYLAEHPRIGKKVALKVLHAEFSANQDITSRFFNEARAVNDIGHPNIVDVIDYGVIPGPGGHNGMVYFIMELLQGLSLSQVIREQSPLAPERALVISMQIADALAASHRHRIVHRDLKPDNIILLQRGVQQDFVKVLDFGIAKLTGDQPGSRRTRTGIVMGTPAYMSPEQCEGKGQTDHRTDVYALGIVLYEMLTGRVPFLGEGYGEVLVQHLTAVPLRPSTIRGLIPPHVEAVCMKALEKRPDMRYPSMDEFMQALRDPVGYVEARGGLGGFVSANLGAPTITPTPIPGQLPMSTPPPGSAMYPAQYPTPAPQHLYPTPAPGAVAAPTGAHAAPARSRGSMIAIIGGVVLALGAAGVVAMKAMGKDDGGEAAAPAAAPAPVASPGQPAVATPAVVATPDPVAEVKKVTIEVDASPAGAEVYRDDIYVGTAPTKFTIEQSDKPFELVVKHAGFVEERKKIVPSENRGYQMVLSTVTPPPEVAAVGADRPADKASKTGSGKTSSGKTGSGKTSSGKSTTSGKTSSGKSTTSGKTGSGKTTTSGNNTLDPDF